MPHYVTETWIPDAGSGIPRRDEAGGPFLAYVPDHLASKAWTFSPELTSRAARIEREILRLNRHAASGQLESVARLLMRCEAISSSRIEGIAPNVDKVVLAELAQEEEVEDTRRKDGMQRALRADSLEATLLRSLPAYPIVTVRSIQRLYGITPGNARKALDRLSGAGILRTKVIAKNGGLGYYADDILSLLDLADRQLASNRFDTRLSPPTGRAVPQAQS